MVTMDWSDFSLDDQTTLSIQLLMLSGKRGEEGLVYRIKMKCSLLFNFPAKNEVIIEAINRKFYVYKNN